MGVLCIMDRYGGRRRRAFTRCVLAFTGSRFRGTAGFSLLGFRVGGNNDLGLRFFHQSLNRGRGSRGRLLFYDYHLSAFSVFRSGGIFSAFLLGGAFPGRRTGA
ncbi:hypothetical protein AGMMS50268_07730 [Spirochaetia bacterium]|nr:hypothetical protein AGMMS50268_07730 [Spirochaetia bacterium]